MPSAAAQYMLDHSRPKGRWGTAHFLWTLKITFQKVGYVSVRPLHVFCDLVRLSSTVTTVRQKSGVSRLNVVTKGT